MSLQTHIIYYFKKPSARIRASFGVCKGTEKCLFPWHFHRPYDCQNAPTKQFTRLYKTLICNSTSLTVSTDGIFRSLYVSISFNISRYETQVHLSGNWRFTKNTALSSLIRALHIYHSRRHPRAELRRYLAPDCISLFQPKSGSLDNPGLT